MKREIYLYHARILVNYNHAIYSCPGVMENNIGEHLS